MNNTKHKVFESIWFWWFLFTLIYTILNFSGSLGLPLPLGGYVMGFFGLFVPFGLWSSFLLVALHVPSIVALFVFIGLMIFANKKLKTKEIVLWKRILINLLILLLITTLVDFMRGTFFESWKIMFSGGDLDMGF
ncbi:hypothetical protein COW81_03100 [Candidatus Campbellbacteria bacterium CG22_combo_CG10-13_8_21_14_all_36_13]|uniref:Uncharacterized protein n=1 Tax=Candidatus Campbellbacteria bacterium CG22_combo_CG10-13_8_21_14_all_36_13 TaxID=1974529 RepID=A0A2H0DYF5_9BACT|nr:MAG: hypothetical protein COW81_03100 [Candidatus Campbellbacteria bacterium CG22_combo_CG10-13_8_21_14_all_36_13]